MTANKNIHIAQKWFEAFNTHNLDELLSLYDDDAQHYSPKLKIKKPETNGFVKGKAALHSWWQEAFENLPSLQYNPTSFTANDDRIFMEYIRKVAGENEMLVAEVLEIKEGKIIFSRVYHG
jgi:hypothetical protein